MRFIIIQLFKEYIIYKSKDGFPRLPTYEESIKAEKYLLVNIDEYIKKPSGELAEIHDVKEKTDVDSEQN